MGKRDSDFLRPQGGFMVRAVPYLLPIEAAGPANRLDRERPSFWAGLLLSHGIEAVPLCGYAPRHESVVEPLAW